MGNHMTPQQRARESTSPLATPMVARCPLMRQRRQLVHAGRRPCPSMHRQQRPRWRPPRAAKGRGGPACCGCGGQAARGSRRAGRSALAAGAAKGGRPRPRGPRLLGRLPGVGPRSARRLALDPAFGWGLAGVLTGTALHALVYVLQEMALVRDEAPPHRAVADGGGGPPAAPCLSPAGTLAGVDHGRNGGGGGGGGGGRNGGGGRAERVLEPPQLCGLIGLMGSAVCVSHAALFTVPRWEARVLASVAEHGGTPRIRFRYLCNLVLYSSYIFLCTSYSSTG